MTTTAIELFQTETEELLSGSEAIALACALADVDVITAYPIRPYDTVMQYVSRLKADGSFDCDFIVAESEHSQFEIVKHASSVGARTFTGSSGVGWFYAFEAIGLKVTTEQAFKMIRAGGCATVIGMIPVGTMVEIHGPEFLREKKLQGSNMGSNRFRVDMPRFVEFYLAGKLHLDDMISSHIKLEDVNDAFAQLETGEVARNVIMFE